ncbi:hypothetical protein [Prosthecobacter dejongeii]|uniref:Uncharacterized protein n=1 Tax=Prosthecobacter dejongeii TaxID=48465 RepID=A0A7W8DNH6_9BACT|nr:hypothetical protein [Prosthecobacter dejongeii]MBB5036332.1 hypothetical protein [Prosthecobacter dejongeii]
MKTAEIIKWGRWRIAWVSSGNLDEVGKLLRSGEIDGVGLNPHHGFTGDPSFLNELPSFAGIIVTETGSLDCQTLPRFNELRFISLGGMRLRGFDFREFINLVDLRIVWHSGDILPSSGDSLESLYLKGYKPKTKDLNALSSFANLEALELVQAGVTSLDGVQRLARLRQIDVSYCKALVTIAALISTPIEQVHFEACGNIQDIPLLSRCARVRSIKLSSCGKLQSLSFLEESKTIEEFRFVKTEVADGDMSPLLKLKSVGFINKRDYSHTSEQVNEFISRRAANSDHP